MYLKETFFFKGGGEGGKYDLDQDYQVFRKNWPGLIPDMGQISGPSIQSVGCPFHNEYS